MASVTNPAPTAPRVYRNQPRQALAEANFWHILPNNPDFEDVFVPPLPYAPATDMRCPPGIVRYRYDAQCSQAVFSIARPYHDFATGTTRLLEPAEVRVNYIFTQQSVAAWNQRCAIFYLHNLPGTYEQIFCCLLGSSDFHAWRIFREQLDKKPQNTYAEPATFAALKGVEVGWRVQFYVGQPKNEGDYQTDIVRNGQKLDVIDYKSHFAWRIWCDKVLDCGNAHRGDPKGTCPLTQLEYEDLQAWWPHITPAGIDEVKAWIKRWEEREYLLPLVASNGRLAYSEWRKTQGFAPTAGASQAAPAADQKAERL